MGDTILRDEDGTRYSFSNIKTQGYLDGHGPGLDAAVSWLKERAVTLFRDGKDEAATSLRKLADDMKQALRPAMEERSRRHEREFPCILEEGGDE